MNISERCEKECKSERCDDLGADVCVGWHGYEEEHEELGFCGKAAFLSHGCEICQEMTAIQQEIKSGQTPKRVCHECWDVFELDTVNPYKEILFHEGVGVYFECVKCTYEMIDDEEDFYLALAEWEG